MLSDSLLNRNVIRLILTAPPATVLSGVPTERPTVGVTMPPATVLSGVPTERSTVGITGPLA